MTDQQIQLPHALTLKERQSLTLTGITDVQSFDENTVTLHTQMGTLIVHGKDLQLKNLSLEGGQVSITGVISALIYEEARPSGSWLRRLFG